MTSAKLINHGSSTADWNYSLIFSMLFFESTNVIDAACSYLRYFLKYEHCVN